MTKEFMKTIFRSLLFFVTIPILASAALENPLSFDTIENFVEGALRAFVYIALPILAFFFVYAGFLFIKAQGNEGGLSKAKDNFKNVVIGAILILGAWVFATLIANTVSQLVG